MRISNTFGHSLPVTNNRSPAASYAIPFRTSTPCARSLAQQALQIDPSRHQAGLRRDSRDPVGLPHVREDLPLDVLQLVQMDDGVPPSRTWRREISFCVAGSR